MKHLGRWALVLGFAATGGIASCGDDNDPGVTSDAAGDGNQGSGDGGGTGGTLGTGGTPGTGGTLGTGGAPDAGDVPGTGGIVTDAGVPDAAEPTPDGGSPDGDTVDADMMVDASSPDAATPDVMMQMPDVACMDDDNDGRCAADDNCPKAWNPNQEDADGNGTGDVCEGALALYLDAETTKYACGAQTTWADGANGISGTLTGFATMNCETSTGWVGGNEPSALHFGGSADQVKVDIPFNAALNNAVFTAEVWTKVTGGTGTWRSPLTSRNDQNGQLQGYLFYAGQNNRWQAWIGASDNGTAIWQTLDGGPVLLNKWTHLAQTFDGTTHRFYVNGKLMAEKATTGFLPNAAAPTRIGAGATEGAGSFWMAGQVATVAIYKDAQSETAIRRRYLNGFDRFHRDNCAQVKADNPNAPSGPYSLGAAGDGFAAYCNFDDDGGSWTLIGKIATGNYTALSDAAYIDLVANPIDDVGPTLLTSAAAPTVGQVAFLNRAHTNMLWGKSKHTLRVILQDNQENPAADGVYFQKKVSGAAAMDLWHALRNAKLWGNGTIEMGAYVGGYGTAFKLTKGSANFDPNAVDFTHMGDGTFGFWSIDAYKVKGDESLEVTRHGGLLGDGYADEGWTWVMTLDRNDFRWKNDVAETRSLIWLR